MRLLSQNVYCKQFIHKEKFGSSMIALDERGSSLLAAIILVFSMLAVAVALTSRVIFDAKDKQAFLTEIQAGYIAESGIAATEWYLNTIDKTWTGDEPQEHILGTNNNTIGSYMVVVTHGLADTVRCTGYVPNYNNYIAKRTVVLIRDGNNLSTGRIIF